jgi:hypothetical protein
VPTAPVRAINAVSTWLNGMVRYVRDRPASVPGEAIVLLDEIKNNVRALRGHSDVLLQKQNLTKPQRDKLREGYTVWCFEVTDSETPLADDDVRLAPHRATKLQAQPSMAKMNLTKFTVPAFDVDAIYFRHLGEISSIAEHLLNKIINRNLAQPDAAMVMEPKIILDHHVELRHLLGSFVSSRGSIQDDLAKNMTSMSRSSAYINNPENSLSDTHLYHSAIIARLCSARFLGSVEHLSQSLALKASGQGSRADSTSLATK